ncbi:MAG: 50S ribosomal protein L15 [Spirochaetia bacterium]|nr:50S ribosomal protein L15 [Spirochaetia bacterium]
MSKRVTKRLNRGSILSKPKAKNNNKDLSNTNNIQLPLNSRKSPKRVGRGPGSGNGTTAGRGQKGQKARASSIRPGFEGGQMRLYLRMPKRGFKNIFKEKFQAVNLLIISKLGLTGEISPDILQEKGIISNKNDKIKILGSGDIKASIKITADAVSASALEKIKSVGGDVIIRGSKP